MHRLDSEAAAVIGVDRDPEALAIAEARKPMGLPKWEHIDALLREPAIASRWRDAQGAAPQLARAVALRVSLTNRAGVHPRLGALPVQPAA